MNLFEAALDCQRRGLSIFPCQIRGKEPACARGCMDATTELDRITGWWGQISNLNIGLATGKPSGLFVVDVDDDTGRRSLAGLEAKHGKLPPTISAITGRGEHLYFKLGKHDVRNSAGLLGPGLDVRGTGGYVLLPPSIHPSGRAYAWSVDSTDDYAAAPDWLYELLKGPVPNGGAKGKPHEQWHRILTNPIKDGERNATLTSICGKLLHFGVRDLMLLLDVMLCINIARCDGPLPETEVETIVKSVVKKHLGRLGGNG